MSVREPGMLTHGFASYPEYLKISPLPLTPQTLVLDPAEIAERLPTIVFHSAIPNSPSSHLDLALR
ncbi:hypothetical protein ABH930_007433 [Kitasatospora sp. GAS204A]|nr:hypothetical protein [Kitasatospora sp. GAS204B]